VRASIVSVVEVELARTDDFDSRCVPPDAPAWAADVR
jgi:hypothetical protein